MPQVDQKTERQQQQQKPLHKKLSASELFHYGEGSTGPCYN